MTLGDRLATTYHRDVTGIPTHLARPLPGLPLHYSRHALEQAGARSINEPRLPSTLPSTFDVVETTVWGGTVMKWLLRLPWTSTRDLVLVLNRTGYVRTLWTNDKTDQHATLNHSRYARTA